MSNLDDLLKIVSEIRKYKGYENQKDVAQLTPYKPATFSKILTNSYGKSQDRAVKRCLTVLQEILKKLESGEEFSLGPARLWQNLKTTLSNVPRREVWKTVFVGSVVALTMLYPLALSFDIQTARHFSSDNEELSNISLGCIVNLFVAIALLYLTLLSKVAQIKNDSKNIRRGVILFSSFWSLTWLTWIILYIEIWLISLRFPKTELPDGINAYLAVMDLLNLLNSFCVLGMFIALYFVKVSRGDWWLLGLSFLFTGWLAIGDRMYDLKSSSFLAPLEGQGRFIVAYVSALSFLLLIGRLNSLFIKVNFKLHYIFIFYLYALLQIQLGPGDLKKGVVLFYSLPKLLLWVYIYKAFYEENERLPAYLDRAYRET